MIISGWTWLLAKALWVFDDFGGGSHDILLVETVGLHIDRNGLFARVAEMR